MNIHPQWRISDEISHDLHSVLKTFDQQHAIFRLWAKDATLFTNNDEASMLDWLHEPNNVLNNLPKLVELTHTLRTRNFSSIVLLGMGGSSLSSIMFQQIFAVTSSFFVVDTIHPSALTRLLNRIDLRSTLFVVASKSGTTLEPLLLYRFFLKQLIDAQVSDPFSHFMAITDPVTWLEQESSEHGFLPGPFGKNGVGGRFSALSVFGMMPALLMGIDIRSILLSAIDMARDCGPSVIATDNPAAKIAAFCAAAIKHDRDQLIIHLSATLAPLGLWLEQLIAESLGKNNTGLVPIITDDTNVMHGPACLHFFISQNHESTKLNVIADQLPADAPCLFLTIDDIYEIGGLMFCFQLAISLLGSILVINPFDQPNVEESKTITKDILSRLASGEKVLPSTTKPDNAPFVMDGDDNFFSNIKQGDYVAILSYLDETKENRLKLHELSDAIACAYRVCVMVEVGPRYLHSTGQLFKGGKNNGHFLVITGLYNDDLMSDYQQLNFSDIHLGQALGDINAMRQRHRRLIHFQFFQVDKSFRALLDMVQI